MSSGPAEQPAAAKENYDEDHFEDYSGSEGEDAAPESDLHKSVAQLRLDCGRGKEPVPVTQGLAMPGGSTVSEGSLSKISSKAEALRTYLLGQMEAAEFEQAYALVRDGRDTAAPEELQGRLAEAIGDDRAKALFQLFQLLCFLEDVATAPDSMGHSG